MVDGRILVKSGGFATQLATHVGENIDEDPLWSARFDAVNPTAVIQTHLDFLRNGAQIIQTNTYQASIEGFMKYLNLSKDDSIQLMKKSVQLSKAAKEQYLKSIPPNEHEEGLPIIIASIGPYGAHLHDASEYSGNYADIVPADEIRRWHKPRIEAILSEGVDGLAIETIPCLIEAETIVDLLCDDFPQARFWISFQCKDGTSLAHGEKFSDAASVIWNKIKVRGAAKQCIAIGVNCLNPKFVTPLLKSIETNENIPFVVYSNRGEDYDKIIGWTGQEKCVPLDTFVPEWIQLGVKIIGGCCRVYPSDILSIRKCINKLTAL